MLAMALQVEASEYVDGHRGLEHQEGQALVVRTGKARAREVTLGSGTVEIQALQVHDRWAGERLGSLILQP